MRLLFTSDVHGLLPVYRRFARMLRKGEWDAGVIAGDLRDPQVPPAEIAEMFGLGPDEFLDELPSPEETIEDTMERALRSLRDPDGWAMKALRKKEDEIMEILDAARKPVFIVRGNHDETEWRSAGRVINVEGCRLDVGRWNVVGCRGFLRGDAGKADGELRQVRRLVDRRTVLVSHVPARGVLDRDSAGRPIGNRALRALVEAKRPRVFLCGHVHEAFGVEGRAANGSWPRHERFLGIDLDAGRITVLPRGRPVGVKHRGR